MAKEYNEEMEVKEVKEEVKEEVKQPKKRTQAQLRKILKECEVVVVNNSGSHVYYKDENTGEEIDLFAYGDTDVVEIEVIRKMNLKKKSYLEKYWLLITDVICDEDVSLEDVYNYLGISKLYKEIENPNEDFFNELLLNVSMKDFERYMEKMNPNLITLLAMRASVLYLQGRFMNALKMRNIEKAINREGFFEDARDI